MADNTKIKGPADASRVNISEPYEVTYWSDKFQVSSEALKATVRKVGPMSKNVERELSK